MYGLVSERFFCRNPRKKRKPKRDNEEDEILKTVNLKWI
jgi:hypothetical protein